MRRVEEFHREISAKAYRYIRPGLEKTPWGTLETGAIDPFGNLIRFCEPIAQLQRRESTQAGTFTSLACFGACQGVSRRQQTHGGAQRNCGALPTGIRRAGGVGPYSRSE
jgi:hypothetical protein